jgi:hypothetical protein
MKTTDLLIEKWSPVLNAPEAGEIRDHYRKAVTAQILENQEKAMKEEALMSEAVHSTSVANSAAANWNPILISLVRRAMPNLVAYDICGVQPMSGPTGLIFAMKSRYTSPSGAEALFDEADTDFSGTGTHGGGSSSLVGDVVGAEVSADTTPADAVEDNFGKGTGVATATGEDFGGATTFNEMSFSIEKSTVTAKTRALKAEYTMEIAQDLKAIHGIDAEAELANILSTEILAEINREVVRSINVTAKAGAQTANITTPGTFSLSADADGRWSAEKFRGLVVQLDFEANQIAKDTRRGKGNFVICSSNVATALHNSGMLAYTPALNTKLDVDDTGNTFAGVLNGKIKVYIDPYATVDYVTVGYRGTSPYDAGLFYCPYVPLTMVRAVNESTFQPKIGFKTRYGMVANPYASGNAAIVADTIGAVRSNVYYRIFKVTELLNNGS